MLILPHVLLQAAPTDLIDWLSRAGFVAFLLFVLWAGIKEDPLWVPGTQYRRCEARSQRWEKAALRGTNLAEAGVDELERRVRENP